VFYLEFGACDLKFNYMENFLSKINIDLRKKGRIIIKTKVHPNAPATGLKGILADGTIKIDVAATPERGRANKEIIEFFAQTLDLPRSKISIKSGHKAKLKLINIRL
jgi:hypothetical protein